MLDEIMTIINENCNEEQSRKMSAYMKDNFKFAGIPTPVRNRLFTPWIKKYAKQPLSWELIFSLWNEDYREAQYAALGYLQNHHKELKFSDIDNLKYLIINKSWWETADTIDALVGEVVINNPSLKDTMLEWAKSENIWLRRVSIDFQQKFKDKTDTELLERIIVCNLNSNEFFINKAIGWSLREYSKINAEWVRSFISRNRNGLSSLSIKEASKYL